MNSSQTSVTSQFIAPVPPPEIQREAKPPPSTFSKINIPLQPQPTMLQQNQIQEALERNALYSRSIQSPHNATLRINTPQGDISPTQAQKFLLLMQSQQFLALANRANLVQNQAAAGGSKIVVNNLAPQTPIPPVLSQKQEEQLHYKSLFDDMKKQSMENQARRTRLFNQTQLAEVTELQAFGNEDAQRISNESAIEYLGPFANRKPRNSCKNPKEKETMSNSKKQKLKKIQLNSIVGVVTQEELFELNKDVQVQNSDISIAMRREMVKEAKREVQKFKESTQPSEREMWNRMIQERMQQQEKLKVVKQQMLSNFLMQNKHELQNIQDLYYKFLVLQDFMNEKPQQVTKDTVFQMEYFKLNLQKILTSLDPLKKTLYTEFLKEFELKFKARKKEIQETKTKQAAEEPQIYKRAKDGDN